MIVVPFFFSFAYKMMPTKMFCGTLTYIGIPDNGCTKSTNKISLKSTIFFEMYLQKIYNG